MKRNNKKGFTIVELVIVVAVIAILAGVLIPTFVGVVAEAQNAAAVSEAKTAYQQYIYAHTEDGEIAEILVYVYDDSKTVLINDGKIDETIYADPAAAIAALNLDANQTANADTNAGVEKLYVVTITTPPTEETTTQP